MQQHVDTTVGKLAVRVEGEGPDAVLWHSLFVDDASWQRVEPELARHRRLIIITGPGHGTSGDRGRRFTQSECAEAATQVLSSLGVAGPVDWVGNAWGGHVGMLWAAAHPDRCRTLVTLGTPVQPLSFKEQVRTRALLGVYRIFGMSAFLRQGISSVLLSPETRAGDRAAVDLVDECLVSANPAALRNAVVSISLHREDLTDVLSTISAPTLLVTGADHAGWTPAQARDAARRMPRGDVAVVDGAAYLVPLEAPDRTVEIVLQAWAATPPRAARETGSVSSQDVIR